MLAARSIVASLLVWGTACGGVPKPGEDELTAAATSVRAAIQAELAERGSPDWAGEYKTPGGFVSERLWLAPRTGFAYFFRGCVCEHAVSGSATWDGDRLRLFPSASRPEDACGDWRVPRELLVIRVGSDRYLECKPEPIAPQHDERLLDEHRFSAFAHVANAPRDPFGPKAYDTPAWK